MSDQTTAKVVLLSGGSSGIGRAAAEALAAAGHRVYATSRHPEQHEQGRAVRLLPLDVRSAESVQACVATVLAEAGRIDVLINNAGVMTSGPLESTALEVAESQFETNYFGVARLTQAVLPGMRERGAGLIINLSSLVGFAAIPFLGHYSASKFALEGYTEALRMELAPFGIEVVLLRPGVVATALAEAALAPREDGVPADYRSRQWRFAESMSDRYRREAVEPERVAREILRVVDTARPPLAREIGRDAVLIRQLKGLMPGRLFARFWPRQLGI